MKYFIPILCFFLVAFKPVNAQQPHFIYLQTDNNQPFYVLLKNKNYSSSSIGYIILPKLENGDYRIKVGFAKSETPEQDYVLKVKDNDQGYLIKNFGEKGNGLFNLQTLAVQYSGEIGRQLDEATNMQREAERQKVRLQQIKDSTEKAEAALAEQRKADEAARLAQEAENKKTQEALLAKQHFADSVKAANDAAIAAVEQKKTADALAKQQAADNIKAQNEAKLASAKEKKEAALLAKQHSLDSIKAVNASKIAAARQKALAKHEADSIANAANAKPLVAVAQPKTTETLAQKKLRLAKEAAAKKQADALAQQQIADSTKAAETAKLAAIEAQKREEALEQQKRDAAVLAKQKADEDAEIEAQRKAAEVAQQKTAEALRQHTKDSLDLIEKNKQQADNAITNSPKNDANALIANPSTNHSTSKNVNATIVYEPVVLSRVATDSGTIMTYKIPSSKGWDTVTAFIKTPPTEQPQVVKEDQKTIAETKAPAKTDDGVKFLDIHFKQDSADKASNEMITPVFKETKTVQKKADPVTNDAVTPTSTAMKSAVVSNPIPNSNCRAEANDKDFFALRKKMVAQNDADNMIMVAKKSMREKCYNTLQIRNLSALLITDADRYQFLEAAYPFTSDAYNYASLADLLKDNYYGDRFKVMLKR